MKILYYIVGAVIALTLLLGCGESAHNGETAAEIETAKIEGRMAARKIITRHWSDTSALQKEIENSRSLRARYDSLGHKKSAETFDSAFVSTIRTVNPILGKFVEKL